MAAPLRLLDAQAWNEGMSAILAETRTVLASMKGGGKNGEEETLKLTSRPVRRQVAWEPGRVGIVDCGWPRRVAG